MTLQIELSPHQQKARAEFQSFVAEHVAPHAGEWDRRGEMPRDVIELLRQRGYLGAPLPEEVGGGGMEPVTYGLLTEAIGYGCSSLRSLLTVHDMITLAVQRWGQAELKEELVPHLARAEKLGALALSEPEAGSDPASVATWARRDGGNDGGDWVLEGEKKWTTFGQIADEFLVLAHDEEGDLVTFLVPATAEGFSRRPMKGMVGTRASLLAELQFDDCRIPDQRRIGRTAFGLSHVIGTALDHGRYSVAWGAVGIAQACLDACLDYAASRHQGGALLQDHQLIQRQLTDMICATRAARLLCYRAGHLRATQDPGAVPETMIAKYFASKAAVKAANDAVQLHGANGLYEEYPLERYLRDAKVTEIIEGSSQIQQISIPRYPLAEL